MTFLVNLCAPIDWRLQTGTFKICLERPRFLDWWCLFCGLRYRGGFPSSLIPWRVSDQLDSQTTLGNGQGPEDKPSQRPPTLIRYTGTISGRRHVGTPGHTSIHRIRQSLPAVWRFSTEFSLGRGEGCNVAQHGSAPTKPRTEQRLSADLCFPEKRQSSHLQHVN